ncbi:MAG: hypothetical protein FE78DRAFT_145107, partial [Acidomyces sp. 'richmondensis']
SGLGFAICCRLIDEFLYTRPQSEILHLLYSTRDTHKSADTLRRLNAHLQKTLRGANDRAPGVSLFMEGRVKIEGVLVDLTRLLTVKALAENLLRRGDALDAVIWNAGIAGWKGTDWLKASWEVCTGLIQATTYPGFMMPDIGLLAKKQLQQPSSTQNGPAKTAGKAVDDEPKLGQVFLANVFGHYMLTHWLAPLFTSSSRIIWISSVSAIPSTFRLSDLQGLQSRVAYESSKRLTDLLVLTSELPSTRPYVSAFLPIPLQGRREGKKRPKMLLTHPGVIGTSIAGLNWFMNFWMLAAMYLARWIGSPWHPVTPYKGATSAVFAALSPPDQLVDYEEREGKGKWGSATDVYGGERVARTDVQGWGYSGVVGQVPKGSVTAKVARHVDWKETTREEREQFEVEGQRCWREMEELRREWEARLGAVDLGKSEDT